MTKLKTQYVCNACGSVSFKWSGQCGDCGEWNVLHEVVEMPKPKNTSRQGYAGQLSSKIRSFDEVELTQTPRITTGLTELDRVLGGGIVPGSVILVGGDPGIGKSTILLQTLCHLSQNRKTLYVTGEESLQQVVLRAQRLGLTAADMGLLAETQIEAILQLSHQQIPQAIVIDSIQTIFTQALSAAPGAVSQVRECAAQLVQLAKRQDITIFIIGHVTKEGALAGPRVLEHMVDTVLYFEGQRDSRYRLIRAFKNRFGAVNEVGIFAMTDRGLKEVSNPSAIFLSRYETPVAGSAIMVTWEGSRPMLVEVQALVDQSHMGNPRRVPVGVELNRLTLCLAVLHRHGGIPTFDQDVFINVVGGVRLTETGVDLALLVAVVSSLRNQPLEMDWIFFGEVGLAGEIRPVQGGLERLHEAQKHGFKKALVPAANIKKQTIKAMTVHGVTHLQEALTILFG